EYRHRGIGKKMMNYLAAKAVADGCGRFEWSVLDWNQPAIDFYESIGATVMQEWRICRLTGEKLEQFAQKALAK
ncbi:N-acetyltransferase family protein, partial [Parasutterella sp.]